MLQPLGGYLTCKLCERNLAERIKELIVRWAMVKVRLVAASRHLKFD